MNPFVKRYVLTSSDAEVQALEQLGDRLLGFGVDTSSEWIDGFLTALATAPSLPALDSVLPALAGDQFDRVFADPEDRDQALRILTTRLQVVRKQLNPQALIEDEGLHLLPVILEWDDTKFPDWHKDAEKSAAHAELSATLGVEWAQGFCSAIATLADQWNTPASANTAAGERWEQIKSELLEHVAVLMFDAHSEAYRLHFATHYDKLKPAFKPSRDVLLDEAFFAVQELRLQWLERDLTPPTRHVQPTPGRNDPCHCGSGKKFKKCHGAAE